MNQDQRRFARRTFVKGVAIGGSVLLVDRPTLATTLVADAPVATTKAGRVRGYTDNGINVFKGIRYGADTTGRRFMPPLPPSPWTDVRDALAYGPSAPPQSRPTERNSEACLFLNVWTPGLRDGRKRTVMFYIHAVLTRAVLAQTRSVMVFVFVVVAMWW